MGKERMMTSWDVRVLGQGCQRHGRFKSLGCVGSRIRICNFWAMDNQPGLEEAVVGAAVPAWLCCALPSS